jgi:hypothetical protein
MYGDWVFSAHHRVRRSLTRRNIQTYARELSKAPGFFLFPRGAGERTHAKNMAKQNGKSKGDKENEQLQI